MLILALIALSACIDPPAPFDAVAMEVPAQIPAHGPRLSGGGPRPLLLSWMEKDDQGHSLRYARYQAGSWSAPRSVVSGIDMFVNWADLPSVQPLGASRLAAHWLQRSGTETYAYDVVFAQSGNDGESWSKPIRPHNDGTRTEHGFVSMVPSEGGTRLIWLDGRKTADEPTGKPLENGMTVRTAFINERSEVTDETIIDDLACDCCQTDMAISQSGPVAAYRNRTPEEIRDIAIARLVDGEWQESAVLFEDHWEIPGCPVNGPKVVATGTFVAVAWFTASGGVPAVKLAMSGDGGESFSWFTEIARGPVAGQVGMVLLPGKRVAVSWLHKESGQEPEMRVQGVSMGGYKGDIQIVTKGLNSRSVPQLGISGDDLIFVWTETHDGAPSIHSAKVPVAAL